jgi:metal-responsive CopG/Arc/MetJ family transcriptional regulator
MKNVDFASPMLAELDKAAHELNVSRQAVIKTLLRQALDQHYLAASAATSSTPKRAARKRRASTTSTKG